MIDDKGLLIAAIFIFPPIVGLLFALLSFLFDRHLFITNPIAEFFDLCSRIIFGLWAIIFASTLIIGGFCIIKSFLF